MLNKHYVPILKAKSGEYGALQALSPEQKERMTPLLEIPPVPWDHATNSPAKTIDEHLLKVDSQFEKSWGTSERFFVDLLWIGEREKMLDGTQPLTHLFRRNRSRNLQSVPVTGLLRSDEYQKACREVARADNRGICLRLLKDDFEGADIDSTLTELLTVLKLRPTEADLILDLGSLRDENGEEIAIDAISLIRAIPNIKQWRSFVLAATGFPVDLVGIPPSDISPVYRSEWALWRNVSASTRITRIPTFGDYAIAHPQPPEVDPRVMRPSASIRYTAENEWLVLKGKNLRNHGYAQFHDVSKALLNNAAYSGAQFSWGDRYISDCAAKSVGCGNLTTWRKVGTSHHLAYAVQQIANHALP